MSQPAADRPTPRPRPGRALRADLRAGARASAGGVAVAALVELIAVVWVDPGRLSDLSGWTVARLVLLDATLFGLMWLVVLPVTMAAAALPRVLRWITAGRAAAADMPPWLIAPSRWSAAAAPTLLAGGVAAVVFALTLTRYGARWMARFREPILTALLIAVAALVLGALLWFAARVGAALVTRAARALARRWPRLVAWTPIGSPWLAAAIVVALAAAVLLAAGRVHPHLRPVWPWRTMLTALAFVAGVGLQLELGARFPARRPRRRVGLIAAGVAFVLVPSVLVRLGGDPQAKYLAVTGSPTLARAVELVRAANDLDGDGFGSLLGENDCAPRDPAIRPGARDYPDNGIDENCDGRDFSMRDLAVPTDPDQPVPVAFRKPWNVLFITIDTVRYDHTSFGGSRGAPLHRDITPRLAELASRSTSFAFAQAPSAGTMASVPAILTSRYFHSGIALDETNIKTNMPPRLKQDNWTLPEIMKRGGYVTGAILTHPYFNDWGLDQGVDDYDNDIGKTHDAYRVSADRLTDRGLAWIARHPNDRWFLWMHYLDPHSQYVAHPGETSFGDSPMDLYHGELHFTDRHVGRLLDELIRLPGGERTIVVVTSDHGDAFGEHGFDGHAVALTREILHVPLLFYVPDNPPRVVGGAVSNLDVVPTLAALCGIDVSDLAFEGKSLVPQIFWGEAEPDRVVFAETNFPNPQRAAVSSRWKLIYNMKGNFHELYDLRRDPHEKNNVASREPAGMKLMKPILDKWLERVVFARDPEMSQVAAQMRHVLLASRPSPPHPVSGVSFDGGAIEVIGFDLGALAPGASVTVTVYYHVVRAPSRPFKLGVGLWGLPAGAAITDPPGLEQVRSKIEITLDGLLPTDHWRPGDYLRDRYTVTVPRTWASPSAGVGLVVLGEGPPDWQAPIPGGDTAIGGLGVVPVIGVPAPPPPAPTTPPPPTPPGTGGTGATGAAGAAGAAGAIGAPGPTAPTRATPSPPAAAPIGTTPVPSIRALGLPQDSKSSEPGQPGGS